MKPIKNKRVYTFKKGDTGNLDGIYEIMGLFIGGVEPWWEPIPDFENPNGPPSGETFQIQRDITIEVIER